MTQTSPTIRIETHGGPEVMKLVDLPVGEPGAGEIRIRHHACGLNFIDVYQRSGVYATPTRIWKPIASFAKKRNDSPQSSFGSASDRR